MRAILIQNMIVTCPHGYGILYNEAEHKFSILRSGGHLNEMITIPSDDLEEAAQKGYTDASFKVKDGEIVFSARSMKDKSLKDLTFNILVWKHKLEFNV